MPENCRLGSWTTFFTLLLDPLWSRSKLIISMCPLLQVFINRVYPYLSLSFRLILLILKGKTQSINDARFARKMRLFWADIQTQCFCNPISFGMIICPPRKNSVDQRLFDPFSTLALLKGKAAFWKRLLLIIMLIWFQNETPKLFLSYRISIWIHLLSLWNMNTHC